MQMRFGNWLVGCAALILGVLPAAAHETAAPPAIDANAVSAALDPVTAPGTILIARGDTIVFERAIGEIAPGGGTAHELGKVWRWASVTKQVTATIAMQEVAAGRLDLDAPIIRCLPDSKAPYANRITARMLMQHVSGLPRTEEGPVGRDDWPTFYMVEPGSPETGRAWCEGPTAREPLSEFFYGDCDFVMMGAVIEATSGKSYETLIAERIAQPLGLTSVGLFPRAEPTVAGFAAGKPESSAFRLENFGAAGALYGTARDLLVFDRALMTGKLLPEAQRAVMWEGKPEYGYAALGQWSFSVPLKDCGDTPVRIVERRGFIGGVVLRNIILPELDMVIIMTSNRAEAEAAFGEIWQQAGVTHDLIRAAVCPTGMPL
ncbi:serine hydrolase domain-containing protein [Altererythrobacter sp. H2]|uniref:serine hydrolase domain-containing protein n=1 Tax=Altererythrobacter sp. H2 TaxID=3108391 RepID=UPI002B4BC416|nr:serine hydrolase domain-containing protein [Altererythrobacter sp. H2]WRK97159.1 serine hydrolase domain-containing protein [Altererythrobacter sp. H2]